MKNLIITGVNLTPGSKVLINTVETFTQQEMIEIKTTLEAKFPGVEFVLLDGLEIIGVYNHMPTVLELEN